MFKLLASIQKNLVWMVPIFMIMGFITGIYAENVSALKIFITPLTFFMVYPMMVNLQLKKIVEGGDTKVQIVTQLINFGLIPFVAFFIGKLFFADQPFLALGLLLASLLPTSGMTISWTGMSRGNMAAAVKMTVFGLLLGSILTPFYIKWLMGTTIEIPLAKIFFQIVIVVVLPLVLGNITQKLIIKKYGMAKYQKSIKMKFPPISTLGVLLIVFVAMALKSKSIMASPKLFLSMLPPLLLLYFVNIVVSSIIGKKFFGRGDGLALVYGTVLRNLSIALAIAMTVFGKEGSTVALIIALAYIIQTQVSAWYAKFANVIFGEPEEELAKEIMREGVIALHSSDSIMDAIKLFAEEHIFSIAVLDRDDKAIGMLSSNTVMDAIADGLDKTTTIHTLQLTKIVTVKPETPFHTILQEMKREHQYKVLILDNKGVPSHVITREDILEEMSRE